MNDQQQHAKIKTFYKHCLIMLTAKTINLLKLKIEIVKNQQGSVRVIIICSDHTHDPKV